MNLFKLDCVRLVAHAFLLPMLALVACSDDDNEKTVPPLRTDIWTRLETDKMTIDSEAQDVTLKVVWSNQEWKIELGEGDIVASASPMEGGDANDKTTAYTNVTLKCNANKTGKNRTQTISVVSPKETAQLLLTQEAEGAQFQVYLCFGQSNMEGNALPEAQDFENIPDNLVNMAVADNEGERNRVKGQWYEAVPPLCRPKGWQDLPGLTPADYFGRTMAEAFPEDRIGIIMIGIGGAGIEVFNPDGCDEYWAKAEAWHQNTIDLYGKDHKVYGRLVEMAKKAQADGGVIRGILLHQGETNNGQQDWARKVADIYEALIADLGLEASQVPLLAGETLSQEMGGVCWWHNQAAMPMLKKVIPNSYVVSSKDCPAREDGLHFTAEGYRMIGKRYAETMLKTMGK